MTGRSLLIPVLLALLFGPPAVSAADRESERIMAFADHLFEQADYYRAITEYERLLFHYPEDPLAGKARFRIALCYFRGDRLLPAIERFRALAEAHHGKDLGRDALFMLSEAHLLNKDYPAVRAACRSFLAAYPADPRADACRIRIGWSFLREGDWRAAAEAFNTLPQDSPLREDAVGLAAAALRYPEIPKKSPALAGGLSAALPGAGQLYTGRPRDAVTAFLLNGIFIWGAVEAFRNDNETTGGILLFFEAGWYAGNIYNAVSNAHKYNRRAERAYLEQLGSQYGLTLSRAADGTPVLALSMTF